MNRVFDCCKLSAIMEIGIYGLGRFGFFWADILSNHFKVKGYSRNPLPNAPVGVERVDEDEVLKTDTLFLCVSISSFAGVLKRISGKIDQGTVVIDTCSVKVYPVKIMRNSLPEKSGIIASHPMFGPDSARDGIKDLPIILWPVRKADGEFKFWADFFKRIGLRVIKMEPDRHDREAAFTQGITHYLGRVIADLDLHESEIATVGYKKLLEIMNQTCNDPWQLFVDLQRYNPHTGEMREKLHKSLDKIMRLLDDQQRPEL